MPAKIRLKPGTIVMHPAKPEWGPGKVLAVHGKTATVYWRDIIEVKPGDALKPMNLDYVALEVASSQADPLLNNLPPLADGKWALKKPRFTLEQSIEFFLTRFPKGFEDPRYLNDQARGERGYKWAAHESFVTTLGDGQLGDLLANGEIVLLTKRALAVVAKVNLLSVFEATAFRDALRNESSARSYFSALDGVLRAPQPMETEFGPYIKAVTDLPSEGKTSPAKWPVLTVLPYLARPDTYMFLKPDVTKECAARLAFNLNYSPQLNWLTYEKLLEMSSILRSRLEAFGARDLIDIQSFIWVIGNSSE